MRSYMTKPQVIKDIRSTMPGLFATGTYDNILKMRVWNILMSYYKDHGLIPRASNWSYPKPKSNKHGTSKSNRGDDNSSNNTISDLLEVLH